MYESIILIAALALAVVWAFRRAARRDDEARRKEIASRTGDRAAAAAPSTESALSSRLHQIADGLQEFFDESALPDDLLADTRFRDGVRLLADASVQAERVLSYATGENAVIACLAFEALLERSETGPLRDAVLDRIGDVHGWRLYFALRYLATAVPAGAPGR
jgi:hypothetical protein